MTELTPEAKAAVDAVRAELAGEIDALKTKNAELIREKRELQKTATITPEQLAAVESERDDYRAKLAAAEKTAKDATTAAEAAKKALEVEQGALHRLVAQDGLKSELIKGGVTDPDFLDMALAKLLPGVSVVTEGDARVAKVGDKDAATYVTEYLASDAGKKIVAAPANGGGGAPGGGGAGGGVNPFAKDTFNMTEQARLINSNPTEAAALAKAAGVDLAA